MTSPLARLNSTSTTTVALGRLPTNTTTRNHAVHRWFNFIAGFSPEFVEACISTSRTDAADDFRVLDPFCGCGTTPSVARIAGVSAVAYESHPFFAVISEAKANSHRHWPKLGAIRAALETGFLAEAGSSIELSPAAGAFLGKMFHPASLSALLAARKELDEAGLAQNPLAILALSRILDYCCFAATDGIYKAPTTIKRALEPMDALEKVFGVFDADAREALIQGRDVVIVPKSSEAMSELEPESVDLIVTSPPYLNNFDFAEMTRMYLYFWGMASTWGEITDRVRSRLIVNTTTALKGHKTRQELYRAELPATVLNAADEAVQHLAARRREKVGKKEYDLLVYPYLSQMQSVLRECGRVLKSGSKFHMMVSDAALYGVHLPAPEWLAEIMRGVGFEDVRCELVRPRGHRWSLEKREGAAGGLGEYYVSGRGA